MAAIRLAWLCLLAVPIAAGQALDPEVDVTPVHDEITVSWNGTAMASWLVTNQGPLALDVTLALDEGDWRASLSVAGFALSSGASRLVQVEVAPADPSIPGGTGSPLSLTATGADGAGRSHSDTAAIQTQVLPRPAPVLIPPPPADTTTRDVSIAVVAILVPLAAVYAALGLLYRVHVPRDAVRVLGVHGAWVHVRVRNVAPWSQTVMVQAHPTAAGWQVAGDADLVTVPARGEQTYTVFVRRQGAIDDPARLRILVCSRRSALYPWRRHGHITVDSEPLDLTSWSAKKIHAALESAPGPASPT